MCCEPVIAPASGGSSGWLDLSLNKLTNLIGDQVSNLDRQRATASCELMHDCVRWERSIWNKDWSLVGRGNLVFALHLRVRETFVAHPCKGALPMRLIIAKLEAVNRLVAPIPNDQVEEIITKPPSVVIATYRLFGRIIQHRAEGSNEKEISHGRVSWQAC